MDQTSFNNQSQKRPWSWIWILVVSVLCGLSGGYLIVWQNLKRIGREDVAKKFLIKGGVIVLAITAALFLLPIPQSLNRGLGNGLAIIFPIWFYQKYLNDWQKQNPKVAGFSFALIGWGLLGLILYLALVFLVALIFPQ